MTTYPFIKAAYDYGPRTRPALGLMYHMAEGGGTVGYLDDVGPPPERGVSVHAVCEYSGLVVQMLPWSHISGSLNPADRSVDTGYYGHSALVDVLGGFWTDPNTVVLSMEIEGFAAKGPNAQQIAGAIAWGRDMTVRFPTLRGALGHTDQTDTKACPGLTTAMKSIFTGVGGHGLWGAQEVPDMEWTHYVVEGEDWHPSVRPDARDTPVRLVPDRTAPITYRYPADSTLRTVARFTRATDNWRVTQLADGRTGFVLRVDLIPITPGGDPTVDKPLKDYIQRVATADCDAAVNKALDHVAPTVAAVETAIAEARPR